MGGIDRGDLIISRSHYPISGDHGNTLRSAATSPLPFISKREATLLLLNSFQIKDFFEGILIIQELPSGLAKAAIEDRVGEEIGSVYLVMSTWENIGILTFNHEVSIDTVHDAYGSRIVVSWQKLEQYVTDLRGELQRKSEFEWFQWLAERMMENEKVEPPIAAYLAHRDWQ